MDRFLIVFFLIFFNIYFAIGKNNPPEKKTTMGSIENSFKLTDFGAKGNGNNDDSEAFEKAIAFVDNTLSKTLIIPANYSFNLANKTVDFKKNLWYCVAI